MTDFNVVVPTSANALMFNTLHSGRRVFDRGSDFNAFGFDPVGRLAYHAACFYGPDYVPLYTVQQYAGIGNPKPPRYGPPAPYQVPFLPLGWEITPTPYFDKFGEPVRDTNAAEYPLYDKPPRKFCRKLFTALKWAENYKEEGELSYLNYVGYFSLELIIFWIVIELQRRCDEDEDGYDTEIEIPKERVKNTRAKKLTRARPCRASDVQFMMYCHGGEICEESQDMYMAEGL